MRTGSPLARGTGLPSSARRVELEPIVIGFATREGFGQASDLPVMHLLGLDEEAAAALLDRTAPDLAADLRRRVLAEAAGKPPAPALRRRVLAEAAGTPLALVELPRALREDGSRGQALQLPLPLTERLERS